MKTVIEYLFNCIMDCLSLDVSSTKDLIIGSLQLIIIFAVFVTSCVLLTWYYAIAITVGFVLTAYLCVLIVEFIAKLCVRKIKQKKG